MDVTLVQGACDYLDKEVSMSKRIMVVDDDADIRNLLNDYLSSQGYQVSSVENAEQLYQHLALHPVDLIVLDIMLPGEDGYSICRKLSVQSNIPIIMLTANADDVNRIIGLEIGADDYMAKPFNPRVLIARIKAILRRYEHSHTEHNIETISHFGQWTLNHQSRELNHVNGEQYSLSRYDFSILSIFINNPNKTLSRDELFDHSRGRELSPFDRSLDVHISRLRHRLEENVKYPNLIKTIRGVGYIFTAHVDTVTQ
jgi:two-component system OmpR family response regulator